MSAAGGPDLVTNGLVLHLDAASRRSYNGGTIWRDLAGSNNGTLINGPTFSSANGGSIVFDGVNDYISTIFSLNGSNPLTVSCWFKLNTVTKNWHSIIDAYKDETDRNFQLWVDSNSKLYIYHLGSSHNGDSLLSINTWYNTVFVYSGSGNGVLYLNGLIINARVPKGSGIGGNINVNIGRRTDSSSLSYTNGNIAQVSIYNRALSPAEVLQNYNATRSRFGV